MAHPLPLATQVLSKGEPRHGHAVVKESRMPSVIIVHVLTLALSLSISCCNCHPAGLSPALPHVIHPMTSVLCISLLSHLLKSLLGTLIDLCCALQASLGKGRRVANTPNKASTANALQMHSHHCKQASTSSNMKSAQNANLHHLLR